jgi:hypothetical protein
MKCAGCSLNVHKIGTQEKRPQGGGVMSEETAERERPCLHCLMVELIDDFLAEYPPAQGGSGKVDTEETDEIIEAVAKTVAELTSRQDGIFRQYLIEQLMREIMKFDGEFRREDTAASVGPQVRH